MPWNAMICGFPILVGRGPGDQPHQRLGGRQLWLGEAAWGLAQVVSNCWLNSFLCFCLCFSSDNWSTECDVPVPGIFHFLRVSESGSEKFGTKKVWEPVSEIFGLGLETSRSRDFPTWPFQTILPFSHMCRFGSRYRSRPVPGTFVFLDALA